MLADSVFGQFVSLASESLLSRFGDLKGQPTEGRQANAPEKRNRHCYLPFLHGQLGYRSFNGKQQIAKVKSSRQRFRFFKARPPRDAVTSITDDKQKGGLFEAALLPGWLQQRWTFAPRIFHSRRDSLVSQLSAAR
jgi:hypothetical protein